MKAEAFGRYKKKGELSPVLPDFIAASILEVDFDHLKKLGITHVLVDLDQTIRRIGSRQLEPSVHQALTTLHKAGSFHSIRITTNNFWAKRYADALGFELFTPFWRFIRPIRKPSSKYFERVLLVLDVKPHKIVMIGDKLHSDIVGANKAGIMTVLVKPRGRDYWFDRLLFTRRREKHLLKKARRNLRGH